MNEITNCNIGPLLAPTALGPTPPALPARESRVEIIKAEVKDFLKKAGKDMPSLPDEPRIPKPEEGAQDPLEALKSAAARKRAALLPPIEDSNAFLGRPIAKPPVLIEGLLKQKRIMVLGASSKIGKTWTLINLAISIASGQAWLGLNTTKGKVLYLNFELADDEMQERIEAVKVARCITYEDGQLDVWNLSEHSALTT